MTSLRQSPSAEVGCGVMWSRLTGVGSRAADVAAVDLGTNVGERRRGSLNVP